MKDPYIEEITCDIKRVPLKKPFITALHRVDAIEAVRVKIALNDGKIGFGTATPNEKVTGDDLVSCKEVIENVIAPRLRHIKISNWNQLLQIVHQAIVNNAPAKAALEIALYQLRAQEEGISLLNLLGAGNGRVETDYTISIGSEEQMVRQAKQLVKRGFDSLKIKVGGQNLSTDIDIVEKIADAVGPKISLRVDCNQAWTVKEAMLASRKWMEKGINLSFLEQPLAKDNIAGMRRLTVNASVPIMADESVASFSDAIRMINSQACDYINIKLMKTGGLSEARKINDLAEACGIRTMIGCMIEPVESIFAAVCFAAAQPNVEFVDLDSLFMAGQDPNLDKYLNLRGNKISVRKKEND